MSSLIQYLAICFVFIFFWWRGFIAHQKISEYDRGIMVPSIINVLFTLKIERKKLSFSGICSQILGYFLVMAIFIRKLENPLASIIWDIMTVIFVIFIIVIVIEVSRSYLHK